VTGENHSRCGGFVLDTNQDKPQTLINWIRQTAVLGSPVLTCLQNTVEA